MSIVDEVTCGWWNFKMQRTKNLHCCTI